MSVSLSLCITVHDRMRALTHSGIGTTATVDSLPCVGVLMCMLICVHGKYRESAGSYTVTCGKLPWDMYLGIWYVNMHYVSHQL